jgi:hypothetical protein
MSLARFSYAKLLQVVIMKFQIHATIVRRAKFWNYWMTDSDALEVHRRPALWTRP